MPRILNSINFNILINSIKILDKTLYLRYTLSINSIERQFRYYNNKRGIYNDLRILQNQH